MYLKKELKKYLSSLDALIYFLGILYLLSGVFKIIDYFDFLHFISGFLWVNNFVIILISTFIIALEISMGYCFLMKVDLSRASLVSILINLFIFFPFLFFIKIKSPDVNCMCFGSIQLYQNIYIDILKNILILIFSIIVYSKHKKQNNKYIYYFVFSFLLLFIVNLNGYKEHFSVIESIEPEEVFDKVGNIRSERYLLIDARNFSVYQEDHINGAYSLPYLGEDTNLDFLRQKETKDRIIITYCDSDFCSLSRSLASYISRNINKKVYELNGGYNEWKKNYDKN